MTNHIPYSTWGGVTACCAECQLEPCGCCCYNGTNQNSYNANTPINLAPGAICPDVESLEDATLFNAWTCTVPADAGADCSSLYDEAAYNAYTCTGNAFGIQTVTLTSSVQAVFNGVGPTFNTLDFRWGHISCIPSAVINIRITHDDGFGGGTVVSNTTFNGNAGSYFDSGVFTFYQFPGPRRLLFVGVWQDATYLPGPWSSRLKICCQRVS